jgi:hypothetical protein
MAKGWGSARKILMEKIGTMILVLRDEVTATRRGELSQDEPAKSATFAFKLSSKNMFPAVRSP